MFRNLIVSEKSAREVTQIPLKTLGAWGFNAQLNGLFRNLNKKLDFFRDLRHYDESQLKLNLKSIYKPLKVKDI